MVLLRGICGKILEAKGLQGFFCEEMERGRNKVSAGEGDAEKSRDIPRGPVVLGNSHWSTGGVRGKEQHREVAAH